MQQEFQVQCPLPVTSTEICPPCFKNKRNTRDSVKNSRICISKIVVDHGQCMNEDSGVFFFLSKMEVLSFRNQCIMSTVLDNPPVPNAASIRRGHNLQLAIIFVSLASWIIMVLAWVRRNDGTTKENIYKQWSWSRDWFKREQ